MILPLHLLLSLSLLVCLSSFCYGGGGHIYSIGQTTVNSSSTPGLYLSLAALETEEDSFEMIVPNFAKMGLYSSGYGITYDNQSQLVYFMSVSNDNPGFALQGFALSVASKKVVTSFTLEMNATAYMTIDHKKQLLYFFDDVEGPAGIWGYVCLSTINLDGTGLKCEVNITRKHGNEITVRGLAMDSVDRVIYLLMHAGDNLIASTNMDNTTNYRVVKVCLHIYCCLQ
eukprot:TRINITY_DN6880_c0_g1_i2.p1 TRINITY_DN6880_c0_g1~~TRINITY_DN6880_c0_g1_i2.p1  ORF type:complete len:240 (-),score=12.30 TRINITY_DN6880_c0_g1_i2:457-1140(-)